jgi:hypothetical protein
LPSFEGCGLRPTLGLLQPTQGSAKKQASAKKQGSTRKQASALPDALAPVALRVGRVRGAGLQVLSIRSS